MISLSETLAGELAETGSRCHARCPASSAVISLRRCGRRRLSAPSPSPCGGVRTRRDGGYRSHEVGILQTPPCGTRAGAVPRCRPQARSTSRCTSPPENFGIDLARMRAARTACSDPVAAAPSSPRPPHRLRSGHGITARPASQRLYRQHRPKRSRSPIGVSARRPRTLEDTLPPRLSDGRNFATLVPLATLRRRCRGPNAPEGGAAVARENREPYPTFPARTPVQAGCRCFRC